jgi:CubicO group peptidase (beta-lactamase class C family)
VNLESVSRIASERGAAAQLCVIRDGRIVLDRAWGVDPEARFLLFSAGKPLTSMLVHRLAGQGAFALDDPIAKFWPEFGTSGKDAHHHPARAAASVRTPVREKHQPRCSARY